MTLQGIDVSNWKNIDVSIARDFVIVQTTWGSGGVNGSNLQNSVSTIADKQMQRAYETGKKTGFMHYYMGGDVNAEAQFFVDHCRGYLGKSIPMIDWESADNPQFDNPSVFEALLTAIEQRTGGPGIAYFQQSKYGQLKPICDRHNWGSMVAQYASMAPTRIQESPWNETYDCAIRQYSSNGQLGNGVALDLDKFYGDGAAWDRYVQNSVRHAVAPTPPAPAPAPTPAQNIYIVQPGDTLSQIALDHGWGGDYWGLARQNGIGNSDNIQIGQQINVAHGTGSATYVVQPGDTLSQIALDHGWGNDYWGLAHKNGIGDPNNIQIGQIIQL